METHIPFPTFDGYYPLVIWEDLEASTQEAHFWEYFWGRLQKDLTNKGRPTVIWAVFWARIWNELKWEGGLNSSIHLFVC